MICSLALALALLLRLLPTRAPRPETVAHHLAQAVLEDRSWRAERLAALHAHATIALARQLAPRYPALIGQPR